MSETNNQFQASRCSICGYPTEGGHAPDCTELQTIEQEEPAIELDAKKAGRLFFLSFKFSQGKQFIQRDIFSWLHQRYPAYRLNNTVKLQILEAQNKITGSLIKNPATADSSKRLHHKPLDEDLQEQTTVLVDVMQAILDNIPSAEVKMPYNENEFLPSSPHIVGDIAWAIIGRDLRFVQGRVRKNVNPLSADNDPYLSHICYYGLESHPTGTEEYDELFREIKAFLLEAIEAGKATPLTHNLSAVVETYVGTHPEKEEEMLGELNQKLRRLRT